MGRSTSRLAPAVLIFLISLAAPGDPGKISAAVPDRSSTDQVRRFSVDYQVEIAARNSGSGPLHVFLPIAIDTSGQRILEVEVDSGFEGQIERELVYGNRFWHAKIPASRPEAISIRVAYEVERRVLRAGDERGDASEAKKFIASNQHVAVGHPILAPILNEIRSQSKGDGQADKARAIYDWVVDNVEYKKVGTVR